MRTAIGAEDTMYGWRGHELHGRKAARWEVIETQRDVGLLLRRGRLCMRIAGAISKQGGEHSQTKKPSASVSEPEEGEIHERSADIDT
jgi:hypothetical protein